LKASQNESAQTLNRAETKLNSLDAITTQTQQTLERSLDGFYERSLDYPTIRDVHKITQVVRSVETMLHNQLPQSQLIDSSVTTSTISKASESQCGDVLKGNKLTPKSSNASTAVFGQRRDGHSSNMSVYILPQVNQLVDAAVTVRYHQGNPCLRLCRIVDQEFEEADFETKRRMVKILLDLRLMIWLFAHHTDLGSSYRHILIRPQSRLVRNAGIALTWNFWRSCAMAKAGKLPDCPLERLTEFMMYLLHGSKHEDADIKLWHRVALPTNTKHSSIVSRFDLMSLTSGKYHVDLESQSISGRPLQLDNTANVFNPLMTLNPLHSSQIDIIVTRILKLRQGNIFLSNEFHKYSLRNSALLLVDYGVEVGPERSKAYISRAFARTE
jgi:hypothetical protein